MPAVTPLTTGFEPINDAVRSVMVEHGAPTGTCDDQYEYGDHVPARATSIVFG